MQDDVEVNWNEILIETYELAEECAKTNYYDAMNMTKVLLPLLQLSDSPAKSCYCYFFHGNIESMS